MNLIKILLLSVLFIFLPTKKMNCQNNTEGVATYEFQYNLTNKEEREMKRYFEEVNIENLLKKPINWQFKLQFNGNEGVFYLDTLVNTKEESSSILLTGYGYKGTPKYMDADKQTVSFNYTTLEKESLIVKDNLKPANWNISDETKTINGYQVKKATAYYQVNNAQSSIKNEKVTAWFAPQIPINLGPLEFGNLPGLILELNLHDGFSYVLTDIDFEKEVNIEKLKGEREISKEFYDKNYTKITN